jgi:hypothetical protein
LLSLLAAKKKKLPLLLLPQPLLLLTLQPLLLLLPQPLHLLLLPQLPPSSNWRN